MPVTDDQLELLEAYLDGELPSDQEESLRQRLIVESDLAGALETLRAERSVRALVFAAYEPDDNTVRRLVMKVEAQVDRQAKWSYRMTKWRIPSAAAACILLGFLFGWVGRGTSPTVGNAPGQATMIAGASKPMNTTVGNVLQNPVLPSPVPSITTVNASNAVDLPIVDEYGKVVAVQHFNSAEEAAKFVEDVNNWQKSQEKVPGRNIVPTGAEKF